MLYGVSRGIRGRDDVIVGTTAIQLADGLIDYGSVVEPLRVYVEQTRIGEFAKRTRSSWSR